MRRLPLALCAALSWALPLAGGAAGPPWDHVDARGCAWLRTAGGWEPLLAGGGAQHCGLRPSRAGAAPGPVYRVPRGYAPIHPEARLNPYRGLGTEAGKAAMDRLWTDTVPRRRRPPPEG